MFSCSLALKKFKRIISGLYFGPDLSTVTEDVTCNAKTRYMLVGIYLYGKQKK
jgi:hypothetical protein